MTGISDFKANFKGGARPNLFKCIITFPNNSKSLSEKASFLIKGAQLPGDVIAPIEVPYQGRKLKVAGDRTFEPWTITVINDVDMEVRNEFEKWMNLINSHKTNTSAYSATGNHLAYMADMEVIQLDRDGNDTKGTKKYEFKDAFPTNISPIDLNFETNDAIEEFTVEVNYQYWESDGITT